MKMRIAALLPAALVATAFAASAPVFAQSNADKAAAVKTYADLAQAMYEDSLTKARQLQRSVEALIAKPGAAALAAARTAWVDARVPYMQTEVYRFGNPVVEEWEGLVNAWPLDEGLIDYVDAKSYGATSDENPLYTANIIANPRLNHGGKSLDASRITWRTLRSLQEVGGVEANVATGYHAIEFLLWGQDLNGSGPGAGNRPWTDYAKGAACTNGNCGRRADYLSTATQLMVDDLAFMAKQWAANGEARTGLQTGAPDLAIATMLTGMGSLSYGELAGERMKLGLLLHDPEEEHDCFSDNTHNSHFYDTEGMRAVYTGEYRRVDGRLVKGPSLADLVKAKDAALDTEMRVKLEATRNRMQAIKTRAETKETYDQMISEGNAEGNAAVQAAIDALTDQTRTIEKIVSAFGLQQIEIMRSDSLDDPAKVFE